MPAAADPDPGSVWTVVVAAGSGTRFGGPKQLAPVAGRPCLAWSIEAAAAVSDGIVVVLPVELVDLDLASDLGVDAALRPTVRCVAGGATRSASVRAGLAEVPDDAGIVVVHDGARPAATPELFATVVAAVRGGADGVVPGVAVVDSLRTRDGAAVDRDAFVAVQTPQGFRADRLRHAHASGADASDDATLVEAAGHRIEIVDGEVTNTKLTHPDDVESLGRALSSTAS